MPFVDCFQVKNIMFCASISNALFSQCDAKGGGGGGGGGVNGGLKLVSL